MRGAATQAMPVCIVEERQQSRYAPLPPRPSGLRPAGPLAVLLAPYIPHRVCSSLAPCQRAWGPAAECTPYFLTGPNHGFALFASSRLTQVQFHGGGFTLPQ